MSNFKSALKSVRILPVLNCSLEIRLCPDTHNTWEGASVPKVSALRIFIYSLFILFCPCRDVMRMRHGVTEIKKTQ